jgi:putative membrane protein
MKFIKLILAGFMGAFFSMSFLFTEAQAQWGRYEDWHMGPGMMGGWGMGWFGMIFMVVFWILILVGLVFVIKWLMQATGRGKSSQAGSSGAIDILKERYARGEIDKAEYETKKKDLAD